MAKFIKNLKSKVEHYKSKAEEISAMVEEGAETIREIRSDVESTVEDLKADSDEKLMESLEKIQDAERVFKEAGYKLRGLKMEMGFNPKIVSVLLRESEIGARTQDRLIKKHKDNKLLKSMLTSLFKAEALEDKVHLKDLTFTEVHIEVGLVPAVHVLWEDKSAERLKATAGTTSTPVSSTSSPFTSSRSSFTSGSSFSSSRSSAFHREEPEEEEEEYEEEPEEMVEEEAEAEVESEEPQPAPKKRKKKKSSASVSAIRERDPEDDKWISFPDVSFPSGD